MKNLINLLTIVLFFSYGCLKAEKSKFDLSSKNGSSAMISSIFLSGNTVSVSPVAGNYNNPQTITLTASSPGATIYYTVDGSTPTTSSLVYTSGLPIWSVAGKIIKFYSVKDGLADSPILSVLYSYQPLKTRQSTSSIVGDDASANQGVSPSYTGPTQHPTFTNDYTTTDNATGLVWKSCSEGLSGATCIGSISAQGFAAGTNACNVLNTANSGSGFAGKTNWRLPTMKELTTLTDYSKTSLTLDTSAFPGSANFAYWSSTSYPPNSGFGWYVDYSSANSFATTNSNPYHTRCISAPALVETTSYSDNGNGTITDNVTGLIWQKCSKGQTNDTNCTGTSVTDTWSNAITYCNTLSLASKTWRLPNINELGSIYDFAVSSGTAINTLAFPNTPNGNPGGFYWSSSTYLIATSDAWYLNFGIAFNAFAFNQAKITASNIRCVTGP